MTSREPRVDSIPNEPGGEEVESPSRVAELRSLAPSGTNPSASYVPSEEEAGVAADVLEYRRRVPVSRYRREKSDKAKVTAFVVEHPDEKVGNLVLMAALGTRELPFLDGIIKQIGVVGAQGPNGGMATMDFLMSVVKGIEPKDQIEAMLAAQMAATHLAEMEMASRIMSAETREGRESAERSFNRLARTFTTQTEALKRYRTGGEQKVTVEHVTVNSGGQAIVGAVSHPGVGEK